MWVRYWVAKALFSDHIKRVKLYIFEGVFNAVNPYGRRADI